MRITRQGGIWFWQAGRFGGSLYRKRLTLAAAALRHAARCRQISGLATIGGAIILSL
jgi:hypothetical protein